MKATSLVRLTDRGTNRLHILLRLQSCLKASDEGQPIPGLPFQSPVTEDQLYKDFLLLY